jgi:ASC-1-like (ASCH) protein
MSVYTSRLKAPIFNLIKNGTKTIEMRLFDEKRSQFNVGDILIFKKLPEEIETVKTQIIALHKFPTFNELYLNFDKKCLGYTETEVAKPEDMLAFYSLEEQLKYGVVGIEIKLIEE